MNYGITLLATVPCRKEPSDKSEMISQLLFGDFFMIEEQQEKWTRIRNYYDRYESWIGNKQYIEIPRNTYEKLSNAHLSRCSELSGTLKVNGEKIIIPLGSLLPLSGGNSLIENVDINAMSVKSHQLQMRDAIEMMMNAPYLWGGKTIFGIDCSGFTQLIFSLLGKPLPRDAWQQAEVGEVISFIEEAQEGDLAFFENAEKKIIHAGIILRDAKIVHASGKIRIDKLDHLGIYNHELNTYTHKLRIIRRV